MSQQKIADENVDTPLYSRKKLLIEPKFQIWFITYTAGIAFVVSTIFYLSVCYFFKAFAEKGVSLQLPSDHIFFAFLQEQRLVMDYIFGVTVLCSFIVTLIYGLIISNRIAGPLYRLKMYLRDWASGDRSRPLTFRERDHFKELADVVNDCLNKKKSS